MNTRALDSARTDLVVVIRNDIQRFGIERILDAAGWGGAIRHHDALPGAVTAAREARSLLVAAVREVEDPAVLLDAAGAGLRVLLLVDPDDTASTAVAGRLAQCPSVGFLLTTELAADTVPALLEAAARGEMPIPARLARALLAQADGAEAAVPRKPRLTSREQQVLTLLVQGMSNRQIARRLVVSEHAAKRHVANILAKLDCANRTGAVALALGLGLCEVQPAAVAL
ncbi:LuxR C-terminal-related transcriptional regulator [Actinosynnema sp. NPDC059797]